MEDKTMVVILRVIDRVNPAPGTWTIPCNECGELTWISRIWKDKKIDRVVCGHCFSKKWKDKECVACTTEEIIQLALETLRGRGVIVTREELIESLEMKIGKEIVIK